MQPLSRPQNIVSWVFQVAVAVILLQTLFFKFTGAEESRYIFSEVGRFVGVAAVEPWGRIGSGLIELVASVLLLAPSMAPLGAFLTMAVMSGAIASHFLILGLEVKGDGGLLFALALIAFTGSMVVFVLRRSQLPTVGRFFQAA